VGFKAAYNSIDKTQLFKVMEKFQILRHSENWWRPLSGTRSKP
jgi:hypothetical protein